jgi:hypothetical protein
VKYADDLVLLAKEEMVLRGMINRLIEIGRCCGMEMNVEETKVLGISRESSPIQIMRDQKQLENMEYINELGSVVTHDTHCTHEIKSRIAMAEAAFSWKKIVFMSKLELLMPLLHFDKMVVGTQHDAVFCIPFISLIL